MTWLLPHYWNLLLVFGLVLARVGGLVMTAPVFGSSAVPVQVRGLLAIALAALVTPLETVQIVNEPHTILDFALLVGGELLLGVTIGVGIMLLFSGIQVAGQIITQMSGLQFASVVNPDLDGEVPVFSQLLFLIALGVFVLMNGHRMVMTALLDTFVWLPPGGASMPSTLGETLNVLVSQSLALGVRAAAPTAVALLLATLFVGLISRTLPQLNAMSLGFGVNALVTLVALGFSLGTVAWILQDEVEKVLTLLVEMLRG